VACWNNAFYIGTLAGYNLNPTLKTSSSKRVQNSSFDKSILLATTALVIVGLFAIAEASSPLALKDFSDQFYFVKKQIPFALLGFLGLFFASIISYKVWEKMATLLFFCAILLMLLVFVPGIGANYQGASRWLNLGFTSMQPSEFLKLAFIFYIAKVASKKKRFFSYLFPIAISVLLIMLQPDLGTSTLFSLVWLVQVFVSGVNLLVLLISGGGGVLVGWGLIIASEYRLARLKSFVAQLSSPLEGSYHTKQILLALGSGGLFGVGLGNSLQKHLFLPETATDSIFAILAEEVGFFGAFLVILAIGFLVVRCLRVAKRSPDQFSKIVVVGVASWIFFQTLLNIGSMVALVPLTGVPLPFISYGGSAIVSLLFGIGVVLNVSKQDKY